MQGGAGWMGGAEYIKNLALALTAAEREQPERVEVAVIAGQPIEQAWRDSLPVEILDLPPRRNGFLDRMLMRGNRNFTQAVRRAGFDFVFPLTYDNQHNVGVSLPLGATLAPARWAGWIPDFQHKLLPQLFSPAEIAKRDRGIAALARDAHSIVFSSEATAADFRRYCPDAAARAEVLRFCTAPAADWFAGDPLAVQAKYHLPDRFFLISNQLWQHKNHLLVCDALGLLAGEGIRLHFVWTGQPSDFRDKNYLNVVLQRLHERGVAAQVAMLGLIPRAEQIQLMRRSVAVVQPSLCEGWSTVVEDARLLGKTVVLSDLAVHREQDPPGARFFERESAPALAAALRETWQHGLPGPDAAREEAGRIAASAAQLAFGFRFREIARASMNAPR
jgi:glycosyltransferase involved in cell wall biosynthesis